MKRTKPPFFVEYLLNLICKTTLIEEILGDLEEYYAVQDQHKTWKRNLFYFFHALQFLRPFALKRPRIGSWWGYTFLFRNYYKTSVRNLIKSPRTTFINISGLSIAIGICIVIFATLEFDYSADKQHSKYDSLYVVTSQVNGVASLEQYGTCPAPIGQVLESNFDFVVATCRIKKTNAVVKSSKTVENETLTYTEASFLTLLDFPLKYGSKSNLFASDKIVLSSNMAFKYFGKDNPVGKEIEIGSSETGFQKRIVSGVTSPFPDNHLIHFDFLLSIQSYGNEKNGFNLDQWQSKVDAVLLLSNSPPNDKSIALGLKTYIELQNKALPEWPVHHFILESLDHYHTKAKFIKNALYVDDFYEARMILPVIAIIMMLLACLNYMNIAIASATKRLKEIALRKTIGASKRLIIVQFLIENLIITFIALVIGLLLAYFIFLPWFIQLSEWALYMHFYDSKIWIFLAITLLTTGVISGLYPALYIARFEVTTIFNGKVKFGKDNPITKVFLGTQMVLAIITITSGVMFVKNINFQIEQQWGYQEKGVLYTKVPNCESYERLRYQLQYFPQIIATSAGASHIGKEHSRTSVGLKDKYLEVDHFSIGNRYLSLMQLHLIEGSFFSDYAVAPQQGIVVNKQLIQALQIKNALGTELQLHGQQFHIIGVVENFHDKDFFSSTEPSVFTLTDYSTYRYLTIRVDQGQEYPMLKTLKKQWATINPEMPFQGGIQRNVWNDYFDLLSVASKFNLIFSFIAIILASMGLYGLISLNIAGRIREFSIRRVLGAKANNLADSILRQYAAMTILALAVGAPVSYIMVEMNLKILYAYPLPMSYSGVMVSVGILAFAVVCIVAFHLIHLLKQKAVEGLKIE